MTKPFCGPPSARRDRSVGRNRTVERLTGGVQLLELGRGQVAERLVQSPPGAVTPPPGSTYSDKLPHGKPGYVLPEDQRSLGCVGVDATTGRCIGD